ncbi:unnamed protein product [Blepharisma stoltei]|uniref:Ankyrin repeat domain-containing protein n=1 Tax=Blepharisma stoltei TaxID=1481888 RepID=A0AAU9IQV8_9CILI|nr:unnamed protein product [Blepharisma stoltei]
MGACFSSKNRKNARTSTVMEAIISDNSSFEYTNLDKQTRLKYLNWTYLHLAVFLSQKEAVESLLRQGFDVNAQDFHGETPLHLAAVQQNELIYSLLIDAGADNSIENKKGETATFIANLNRKSFSTDLPIYSDSPTKNEEDSPAKNEEDQLFKYDTESSPGKSKRLN